MSSVYSNPVTVLIARMAYHADPTQTGRLLTGWKWYELPLEHPDGQTDFPSVQLFLPDIQETYVPSIGQSVLTLKLVVSMLRSGGIPVLLDGIATVANAIETKQDGTISKGLDGTLLKPFDMAVQNCFATPLSLNAHVTLTLAPRIFDRGHR